MTINEYKKVTSFWDVCMYIVSVRSVRLSLWLRIYISVCACICSPLVYHRLCIQREEEEVAYKCLCLRQTIHCKM